MDQTPINAGRIELQKLKNSTEFLLKYGQGIKLLVESGIINALRVFVRPFIVDGGESVNKSAAQAQFVAGYNQCLDDLVYFDESFLQEKQDPKAIKAMFGAEHIALTRGDITQKELNDRRTTK